MIVANKSGTSQDALPLTLHFGVLDAPGASANAIEFIRELVTHIAAGGMSTARTQEVADFAAMVLRAVQQGLKL